MSITNYIVVVKALEDSSFLISFPDFEGLTVTTDSEENLQNVATEAIKSKLVELKKNNLAIPEAKKVSDVTNTLAEGEFTIYVPVEEKNDFKAAVNNTKNKPNLKKENKALKNKENLVNNAIPKGIAGIFGIIGGVVAIINTLFLSLVNVEIPFFGSYSITFFRGLDFFADFSKDIRTLQLILFFFGVFFITLAGLLIYSSLIKNRNILLYTVITNFLFLLIFYVTLFIMLSGGETKEFISISLIKILLYFVSLALAFLSYFMLHSNNVDKVEEVEKTLKTTLDNGDDKNEKRL